MDSIVALTVLEFELDTVACRTDIIDVSQCFLIGLGTFGCNEVNLAETYERNHISERRSLHILILIEAQNVFLLVFLAFLVALHLDGLYRPLVVATKVAEVVVEVSKLREEVAVFHRRALEYKHVVDLTLRTEHSVV